MDSYNLKPDDFYKTTNEFFYHMLLPNEDNVFQLNEIDKNVIEYADKHKQTLAMLLYPVFKHRWGKCNLFLDAEDRVVCSIETSLRFFNSKVFTLVESDFDTAVRDDKTVLFRGLKFSLEAFSFLYLTTVKKINFNEVNTLFILGVLEASTIVGCCSIPFKQKAKQNNMYGIAPKKILLKSLLISNQLRVFDIWKNESDVLITGGTGTGKTSQIPKLFWWINLWLDGLNLCYEFFDLKDQKTITKRSTVLSLPRKVLITSNSLFACSSLGFKSIKESPIACKFKDVKKTEFHNNNAFDYVSPFVFSINRNTQFTDVNTIIFDEIHEHDTFCDIGIATVRKNKQELKIRNIVLITATVTNDLETLKEFFPKLIEMKIKDEYLFPIVEKDYSCDCNINNGYNNLDKIILKHSTGKGESTLVFFPSVSSINKMAEILKLPPLYEIVKLHREAVLDDPRLVSTLDSYKDRHLIILSTPIAESSITIASARVVIDTGLFFSKRFFSGSIVSITESMMLQRKGRVGRVAPGTYVRLFDLGLLNTSFKKIDNEFLLPYLVFFASYKMTYDDFLIKPTKKRYDDSINYFRKRSLNFGQFATFVKKIYNQNPCSLPEYLLLYLHCNNDERRILSKLDSKPKEEHKDFILEHFIVCSSLAKKLNLSVKVDEKSRAHMRNYYEKTNSFRVEILGNKKKNKYLLTESIVIAC